MWWSGKAVQSIFTAWAAQVKTGQRKKLCKARAVFSYANMLQRKAFHSWQDGIAYRHARQQRLTLAFEDLAGRRLCLAFDAWYRSALQLQCSTLWVLNSLYCSSMGVASHTMRKRKTAQHEQI